MDFDAPAFDVAELAQLAGIPEIKTVANWTDRGLADVYRSQARRGRGLARRYSFRDALRFALMHKLVEGLHIPIPLAKSICTAVYSESFNPARKGRLVVKRASANFAGTTFCPEHADLAKQVELAGNEPCLVLNAVGVYEEVAARAKQIAVAAK